MDDNGRVGRVANETLSQKVDLPRVQVVGGVVAEEDGHRVGSVADGRQRRAVAAHVVHGVLERANSFVSSTEPDRPPNQPCDWD